MIALVIDPLGAAIGVAIVATISATIWWMLHLPTTTTVLIAEHAAEQAREISGNVLVVFSADIHSEVLMALAAKMAQRQEAQLVAIFVIEVPRTLPIDAELPEVERKALEILAAAEEIGQKHGLEVKTRTIRDRDAGPAIIHAAREENARLIVMGAYREFRYSGAPLGKAIDYVNSHTHTDVLIGVSSTDTEGMFNLPPVDAAALKGNRKR